MPLNLKSISRLTVASLVAAPISLAVADIELEHLGTYVQPDPAAAFDESASEIVAFDKKSERLFVTNGDAGTLDIISISDPKDPALIYRSHLTFYLRSLAQPAEDPVALPA